MIATSFSCSGPALLEVRFPERPTCCLSLQGWQVSLSVSSSQRRMCGGVRGWISSCCGRLRASCFLFCNHYINTSSYLLYKSAGCCRQHEGAHDGVWMYVCLCQNRVVTPADLLLLWLGWLRYYFVHLKDIKARGSLIFLVVNSLWQLIIIIIIKLVCSVDTFYQ